VPPYLKAIFSNNIVNLASSRIPSKDGSTWRRMSCQEPIERAIPIAEPEMDSRERDGGTHESPRGCGLFA